MSENLAFPSEESSPEYLELTTAQQGVWYGQLVDPGSPKYNIGECLEIRGGLDERLFSAAFNRVAHLCDSLNLAFVTDDGSVRQRVVRPVAETDRLRRVDLTGADDPVAAAERYMADDMAAVDRLEAPSHHFALLRLGPRLHYWYVRYHHIAVDGLGGALLARTVADFYARAARGEDLAELEPPTGPLRDLVADEAAYRASGRLEADRAYWTGRFSDRAADGHGPEGGDAGGSPLLRRRTDRPDRAALPGTTALPDPTALPGPAGRSGSDDRPEPTDRPGPTDRSGPGAVDLHTGETLPPTVLDGLRRLATGNRTTWSAVLVAAVAAYTARVTGRREVCVGLASHGRHGALRHVVGMTSTVLPLRLAVDPGTTVGDLVRSVAAEMRGALRHRRFSREQLARELNLADGAARLTDLVVNVMGYDYDLDFGGSPATSRLLSIGPVDDVSLFVSERAEGTGPLIGFDTNPALYHPDDVRLHQQAVVGFLAALAGADSGIPVRDLPLLDAEAAETLLDHGRGAALPAGITATSLPEVFAARVRTAPDAPAVVDGPTTLSYGELAERTTALARALTGWGLGAEDGVGVLAARSADRKSVV